MKELWNDSIYLPEEVKLEPPKAIISDGNYSIKAFSDRVELWDLFPGANKKLAEFGSIGGLVKLLDTKSTQVDLKFDKL